MSNLGNRLQVGDVVLGVSDALDVNGLGLVVNRSGDVFWLIAVDELCVDTEAGKENLELVVCASVEVGG